MRRGDVSSCGGSGRGGQSRGPQGLSHGGRRRGSRTVGTSAPPDKLPARGRTTLRAEPRARCEQDAARPRAPTARVGLSVTRVCPEDQGRP